MLRTRTRSDGNHVVGHLSHSQRAMAPASIRLPSLTAHQETCGTKRHVAGRQCVRVVSWGAVCHTVSRSCFRWKKGWLPDGNYVWVAENHVNSVSTSAHLMIRAAQNASTTGRFSCKFHDSLTRWYPSSSEPFLEDPHVSRWSL